MNVKSIKTRVDRLAQIREGFAREVRELGRPLRDPLMGMERKAYLKALADAIDAIERARAVLSEAHKRLSNGPTAHF